MPKKLIWVDIHKKGRSITPTYYFDFDLLNQLGFPDNDILSFLEEMKIFAQKEMGERKNKSLLKTEER